MFEDDTTSEPEDLKQFYGEEFDGGFDSDDEAEVWISPDDFAQMHTYSQEHLEHDFASYREVQQNKLEVKKARGFFAPGFLLDGGGKGKGKKSLGDFRQGRPQGWQRWWKGRLWKRQAQGQAFWQGKRQRKEGQAGQGRHA